MVQLKRNHQPQKNSSGMIVKVGLFSTILAGLFWVFNYFSGGSLEMPKATYEIPEVSDHRKEDLYFLPTSTTGVVIHHQYYSLSYSEKDEQAEWVAYELTAEQLKEDWVEREDNFRPDPAIKSGSATPEDYRNSGYDRGHLVPVADRAFSREAMQETFLMSNISPQAHNFNGGIWRELEELTRTWAKKFNKLYVVTGPVLAGKNKGKIGENGVTVPTAYFKVLLDISEPELKGIGFLLPNAVSFEPLYNYAVSIDEVEEVTGLDFFSGLLSNELEEKLESSFNNDLWSYSKQKHDQRIKRWNKQ